MKQLSKNLDNTRLINFRLRVSDLEQLDYNCQKDNISRTKGLEALIHTLEKPPTCIHTWMHLEDNTRICYNCKATAEADEGITGLTTP
jgi:hypothetical protein